MARILALAAVVLVGRSAAAGPWKVQVEIGGEVDTNVQRVETSTPMTFAAEPVIAPLFRAATHVDRAASADGGLSLRIDATLRVSGERGIVSEDALTVGADVRYLRVLPGRPLAAGARALYVDALPLSGVTGSRSFRMVGGDGLVVLRRDQGDLATATVGGRYLTYKPDHDFDWWGPVASLRYDRVVWHNADDTRTIDIAADARVEHRRYQGRAFVDRCPPGGDPMPSCFAPVDADRADLVHAAAVEATYTGEQVFSARYQVVVVDSNSYGQSLIRHRLVLAATVELERAVILTATLTGQLDQYLDTLILSRDVQSQSFTALDDDNRSSVQVRGLIPFAGRTSLEGRAAYWTDLSSDVDFQRLLLYAGLSWATD